MRDGATVVVAGAAVVVGAVVVVACAVVVGAAVVGAAVVVGATVVVVDTAVVVAATVVVGTAVVVGASVVTGATVLAGVAVSELPPHPETTSKNVTAPAYFLTTSVCHSTPKWGVGDDRSPRCRYALPEGWTRGTRPEGRAQAKTP